MDRPASEVLPTLVANHRRFLAFLRGKVESDAVAEEILQAAFAKTVESAESIRDEETSVAWFYRLLRNAVIDHYRRRDAEGRALAQLAIEMPESVEASPEVKEICACVGDLLTSLGVDDAELLRAVDLEGSAIVAVAESRNLEPGTARVKLHRARRALRKRVEETCGTCAVHGCLDCSCASKKSKDAKCV